MTNGREQHGLNQQRERLQRSARASGARLELRVVAAPMSAIPAQLGGADPKRALHAVLTPRSVHGGQVQRLVHDARAGVALRKGLLSAGHDNSLALGAPEYSATTQRDPRMPVRLPAVAETIAPVARGGAA